jgi:hypothetical protein
VKAKKSQFLEPPSPKFEPHKSSSG